MSGASSLRKRLFLGRVDLLWLLDLVDRRGAGASNRRLRSRRELGQGLSPQRDDADCEQAAEEQNSPPGAQRVRAAPQDQQEVDEGKATPNAPLPLVQDGSEPLAKPDRGRRGPGEHR